MPVSETATLSRAEEHLFLCGANDAAESLCRLNMRYGLAKIHHYQRSIGAEPDATFIGAPDATVTRNENRWLMGIGYGGKIEWSGSFAVLDLKLNGCGVLMGLVPKPLGTEELQERIEEASRTPLVVDGVEVNWDLGSGNHFLELLDPIDTDWTLEWKGQAFLLHSSGHEHRAETPRGPGLYWDQSDKLFAWAVQHETPWGLLRVLTGERAQAYHDHCLWVQRFHMRRRSAMADAVFGPHQTIFHGTHQGLVAPGVCHLGCYCFGPTAGPATLDDGSSVFPITLDRELPVFLLTGAPNFSTSAIRQLGWEKRADRLGVTSRLKKASILPHGAGYAYPWMHEVYVREVGAMRWYHAASPRGEAVFTAPRPLPHTYRGLDVIRRTLDLGMGSTAGAMHVAWCTGGGA